MPSPAAWGEQTSLFLRGTNSSHTLLLVDGVRVGTVSAGLAAFEQMPVEQIERIEIVRGPRSSLYGADAIGGVIQMFTRHGSQARHGAVDEPDCRQPGHDSDGQLGVSGGDRHAWYNLSLGGEYTRGINACRDGAGTVFAGCFANEPDRDALAQLQRPGQRRLPLGRRHRSWRPPGCAAETTWNSTARRTATRPSTCSRSPAHGSASARCRSGR